jgi:hypothetical protein
MQNSRPCTLQSLELQEMNLFLYKLSNLWYFVIATQNLLKQWPIEIRNLCKFASLVTEAVIELSLS